MRRRVVLALPLVLAFVGPPPVTAQDTVAELRAPAKVSSYGGVVAWSEYEPAERTFQLVVRRGGEPPGVLPR